MKTDLRLRAKSCSQLMLLSSELPILPIVLLFSFCTLTLNYICLYCHEIAFCRLYYACSFPFTFSGLRGGRASGRWSWFYNHPKHSLVFQESCETLTTSEYRLSICLGNLGLLEISPLHSHHLLHLATISCSKSHLFFKRSTSLQDGKAL